MDVCDAQNDGCLRVVGFRSRRLVTDRVVGFDPSAFLHIAEGRRHDGGRGRREHRPKPSQHVETIPTFCRIRVICWSWWQVSARAVRELTASVRAAATTASVTTGTRAIFEIEGTRDAHPHGAIGGAASPVPAKKNRIRWLRQCDHTRSLDHERPVGYRFRDGPFVR